MKTHTKNPAFPKPTCWSCGCRATTKRKLTVREQARLVATVATFGTTLPMCAKHKNVRL